MSNKLYLLCWRFKWQCQPSQMTILISTLYPDFWKHQKRYTNLTIPRCKNIQNKNATRSTSQRQKGSKRCMLAGVSTRQQNAICGNPATTTTDDFQRFRCFTQSPHRWPLSSIGNHLCLSSVARASKCENGSGLLKPYQSDPQRWPMGCW